MLPDTLDDVSANCPAGSGTQVDRQHIVFNTRPVCEDEAVLVGDDLLDTLFDVVSVAPLGNWRKVDLEGLFRVQL